MTEMLEKRRQNTDNLRACVTVRCSGKLHKIGLANGGQFILFNHSKQEIARHLTMGELGSDPVRCVAIYAAWMRGTINHTDHPRELSQYRFPKYDFARRVQRKFWRHRLIQQIGDRLNHLKRKQLIQEYTTLVGPSLTEKDAAKLKGKLGKETINWRRNRVCEDWFMSCVVEELVRRGWPTELPAIFNTNKDDIDDDDDSLTKLFDWQGSNIVGRLPLFGLKEIYTLPRICHITSIGSSDNIKISTGNDQYVSSFDNKLDIEAIPIQLAADVAEVGYVNEFIRSSRLRNRNAVSVYFGCKASELNKSAEKIGGIIVAANELNGTMGLTIKHESLTPAAAQLLIDTYRTIEPKVKSILKANAKRLRAKNRFPTTPTEQIIIHGAVPKNEEIAVLPSVNVEEVNDANENDTN